MIHNIKIIAVIPARGGSKGIPRKNLYTIDDLPLIGYVIQAVNNSRYIDTVLVSTDDKEIAEYVKEYKGITPFMRPKELASDTATTISVIHHALTFYETKKEHYELVITLQPTQPLVQSWHIDEAIERCIEYQESIVGVTKQRHHPILLRRMLKDSSLESILPHVSSTMRRQDMEPIYCVNGMVYVNYVEEIINNPHLSLNENKRGYEIEDIYYVDIDTLEDITIMKEKKSKIAKMQGRII